ncbi:hypothetical protein PR202_ga05793 [Eleusine coracana subsp. coracana]|uniref:Uncharacterized protein n=1 Tax=Eleusine coracana subsp. coracana TaxID=191504 RepID=A0AAV5BUK5_ELECO|nr:hypothetical protein PR202_ga05793 [Eleusine coracana subsp. coracana]
MMERESAKKAVEEALAQEKGKITLLSNEVEELKVLLLREQEENNATKSALLVAQERNDDLNKKMEVTDENMKELRVTVKRFEESVTELESSLMIEKQQNKAIRRELDEAQKRVEELTRQVADANGKSTELQTAVQRLQESLIERDASLLTERKENEATKKSITEAHGRIKELLNKIEVTEKDNVNFQDNILRLEETAAALETSLLAEKHQSTVATSQLAETQQAMEVLKKKFVDANRTNDLLQDSLKRSDECTAEKESLLAAERQEAKTTKEELANAQKKVSELLHEAQHSQESRKQLEDIIKRFEADATSRGTILLSEKQAHDTTKKVLTETQRRYEESIKKIQDSDKSTLQLRLTVDRLQEKASATEALLLREREQNNATMKAHAESQERNLHLLKKFEDVDKKICLLQGTVQRLGDNTAKDSLLFSERREKDELKKALADSEQIGRKGCQLGGRKSNASSTGNSNSSIYSQVSSCILQNQYDPYSFQQRSQENGHILNGNVAYAELKSSICPTETRPSMVSSPDLMNQKDYESGDTVQRLLNEMYQYQQPQNDQQMLLKYISQYLGFSGSKPIAAPLIYYCLLHWRSFEETKTGL